MDEISKIKVVTLTLGHPVEGDADENEFWIEQNYMRVEVLLDKTEQGRNNC